MTRYTRLFIEESRGYFPGIAASLRGLREPRAGEIDAREGQRLSHSIKGMALHEQLPAVAALSWAMERGFERLRERGAGAALVDSLEDALGLLTRMIDEVEHFGVAQADPGPAVAAIVAHLERPAAPLPPRARGKLVI